MESLLKRNSYLDIYLPVKFVSQSKLFVVEDCSMQGKEKYG